MCSRSIKWTIKSFEALRAALARNGLERTLDVLGIKKHVLKQPEVDI
jgi:hypothetical protein